MSSQVLFIHVQPFGLSRKDDRVSKNAIALELQEYAVATLDNSAVTLDAWDAVVADLQGKIAELQSEHPDDIAPAVSEERKDPPALWVAITPDPSRPYEFSLVFDIYAKPINRLIEAFDGDLVVHARTRMETLALKGGAV